MAGKVFAKKSKLSQVPRTGFIATGWSNGSPGLSGAGYGIRIPRAARDAYFAPEWTLVELRLEGWPEPVMVEIAKASWRTTCVELIRKDIGAWMLANGLAPWPRRRPPRFRVSWVQGNCFRVTKDDGGD